MLTCPICESHETELFLQREQVPANQNLVVPSETEALKVPRGSLSLQRCRSCGFVFNKTFDLSLIHYGEAYDNTQNRSEAFQKHLNDLVESLIVGKKIQNHRIVEVGCGKGTFLESLVTHPQSKNFGIGFDPSYLGSLNRYEGRLQFKRSYYDQTSAHIQADIVICRHVIEHISQPVKLLQIVREALVNSPGARLFFETPCLEWILKNEAVWDFFYEHCSYYTKDSLSLAFEKTGFQVDEVRHVFDGQYLWLEASLGAKQNIRQPSQAIIHLMDMYATSEQKLRHKWENRIQEISRKGKAAIWGAGAKGVTFANLFDPERKYFDCIIDVNPRKQNHFLPGTGHPIVDYTELKSRNIQTAVLMNPNYKNENEMLLKQRLIHTQLVVI